MFLFIRRVDLLTRLTLLVRLPAARQQASIGAQASAHYALHNSVAWHRGVDSTFGRTQWKDEKTAQSNARLAVVKSCSSSHRLELQQGGNFQRCSDPAISLLMWCDADSNGMNPRARTLPVQQAVISAMHPGKGQSLCASTDHKWKRLLGCVVVVGWIAMPRISMLKKRSNCMTKSSTLCPYARSSRRWLVLFVAFFLLGVWLELQSDGIYADDVEETATHRDGLQGFSFTGSVQDSPYGGWWACVNTHQHNASHMESFSLQFDHPRHMGSAKQREPSALPLTILEGQTREWLVEQRGAHKATVQPPVAYSTFTAVVVDRGTHYDQAKGAHPSLSSTLYLRGVGDLMLGSDQGYVHSLDADVRVRGSLEITSIAECDGRWNFGVLTPHNMRVYFLLSLSVSLLYTNVAWSRWFFTI